MHYLIVERDMKTILTALIIIISSNLNALEENDKHKTGNLNLTQKGAPTSLVSKYFERIEHRQKLSGEWYVFEKRTEEKWNVYVPSSYNPSKPYGIFCFIHSGDISHLPKNWQATIDKHNLIWVSAQNSGNKVSTYWRHCLALYGIELVKERYNIDTNRIFLGGNSGGGRAASILSIHFPDIIKGSSYHIGCNFWNSVPTFKGDGRTYPGFAKGKKLKTLKEASNNYFVFITGTKDFNLDNTKSVHKGYLDAKFKNCKLIVVDGMGHQRPPTEHFDQSLTFLDSPRAARGKEFMAKAQQLEKLKKWGEALKYYGLATTCGHTEAKQKKVAIETEFNEIKEKVKLFNEEKNYYGAYVYIGQVIKKFGKGAFPEAEQLHKSYTKDKAILVELKSAVFLAKIEKAMKSPKTSKEKIKLSLEKVIKNCPGTYTSKKAKKILDTL